MDLLSYTNVSNQTVKDFLKQFHIAKSSIYKILHYQLITVNNQIVNEDYKLIHDDVIKINLSMFENNNIKPWNYKINIVYEDEDILILNKPTGLLVHSDGRNVHTLANAVSYYYQTKMLNRQIRHIHRLDYDTSGLIVYAKHFLAHSFLNYQLESKDFKKYYMALIYGILPEKEGVINLNIGSDRHNSNRYLVAKTGKEAITKYRLINYFNGKSLIEIELETGRTHQIRVHFCHLKHPLVGDKFYGKETDQRLMLHAHKLTFIHPRSFQKVNYETKIPKEFYL